MDLSVFFLPISDELQAFQQGLRPEKMGRHLRLFDGQFPDVETCDMVLIGIDECRNHPLGQALQGAADAIRRQLYGLNLPHPSLKLADLGTLKPKDNAPAYYEMLAYVMEQLIQSGKRVLLLGGSQDISLGQYLGYESLNRKIEYVQVDARFDMLDSEIVLDPHTVTHRILVHQADHLFNYSNLGYQSYFISEQERQILRELNHFAMRYGHLHDQIHEAEPFLRTADMVSLDLSSIRHMDAPGAAYPSPGGFSAQEICQLARYAGLGYRVSSLSLCEYVPEYDRRNQHALLAAMISWYFMEGYYQRRDDYPREDRANLRQYSVRLHASIEAIQFYQHPQSKRWWMEVPYQQELGKKHPRSVLVPCAERDYQFARTDDIPERWWLMYNKLKG